MSIKLNIVEKADSLFRTFGIRGVTIDDICKECGISKKTIYKHYTDKHALANKSLEYHYDKLFKEINSIIKNSSNAIETLFKISMHFRETLNDINPSFVHDLKKFHHDLFKVHQKSKEKLFVKTLRSVIKNGKNEGLIRVEINEGIISKLRIEMIEVAFNQDIFPQKNYNYMDIQIISFDLFLRGIVTSKGLKIYEKTLNTFKS
jgi:AcrR family transcriptional regulator